MKKRCVCAALTEPECECGAVDHGEYEPQQRTWIGLTDEEKESLINKKVDGAYLTVMETIELTEAKLKEKNNG